MLMHVLVILILLLQIVSIALHRSSAPWAQKAAGTVDELEKELEDLEGKKPSGGFVTMSIISSITVVGVLATLCAFTLAVTGCGSTQRRAAIKHAEVSCFEQARASLASKLALAWPPTKAQAAAIALEITGQELACALVALGAPPQAAIVPPAAPAPDAGVEMPPPASDAGAAP